MKERPILMSGPMVRVLIDGRKTQTRRIVKPQPKDIDALWPNSSSHLNWNNIVDDPDYHGKCGTIPFVNGLVLWVKETFRLIYDPATCMEGALDTDYRADGKTRIGDRIPGRLPWKPSIFMPRHLSRITLEVTGVKVERLQDINEEDAKAEGCLYPAHGQTSCYRSAFKELFESINGKGSWALNPWVWAITFRKL